MRELGIDQPFIAIEGEDPVHLALGQLKVEDVYIVTNVRWFAGLGNRDHLLLLQQSAQCHLHRRFFVHLGYLAKSTIL